MRISASSSKKINCSVYLGKFHTPVSAFPLCVLSQSPWPAQHIPLGKLRQGDRKATCPAPPQGSATVLGSVLKLQGKRTQKSPVRDGKAVWIVKPVVPNQFVFFLKWILNYWFSEHENLCRFIFSRWLEGLGWGLCTVEKAQLLMTSLKQHLPAEEACTSKPASEHSCALFLSEHVFKIPINSPELAGWGWKLSICVNVHWMKA